MLSFEKYDGPLDYQVYEDGKPKIKEPVARMNPKLGDAVRRIGSEYSDEVTKINKKEDLMLERKLKYLERQEHISRNQLKKKRQEVERLKESIHDDSFLSGDLYLYDRKRLADKQTRYLSLPNRGYESDRTPKPSQGVRFPPLSPSKYPTNLVTQKTGYFEGIIGEPLRAMNKKKKKEETMPKLDERSRALSLRELKRPPDKVKLKAFTL